MIDTTTPLPAYLAESGGALLTPTSIGFGETPLDYDKLAASTVVVPLVNQGVVAVSGAKGKQLLQGQVTCDIDQLASDTNITGAQCNPQGRMLASFRAFQLTEQECLLQVHASLLTSLVESLSKYAVFFQVALSDAADRFQMFGINGETADQLVRKLFGAVPNGTSVEKGPGGALACRISPNRYQLVTPAERAEAIWRQLLETATPAGTDFWTLQNIGAGQGEVEAETIEMFLPQMLNLQVTGAISFKKGCYTGQEIVARTKYRGSLKKRMYRFEIKANKLPKPGANCFLPERNQRVGNVVSAAWKKPEQAELLVVLNNNAAQTDRLGLGDTPPAPCANLDLPYSVDA